MDKWDKRFMDVAELVSTWTSCFKENRNVGAILVKDKRIIATGYNGAPAGVETCKDRKECMRQVNHIESGTRHEFCYAVHAEQNAILQAAQLNVSTTGTTMYCTHQPCSICSKMIINAGIKRIVFKNPYPDEFSVKLFKDAGVELVNYNDL
jgi:dCMP deaminase